MSGNQYQEVIDWLRSPEGERWSEARIAEARKRNGNYGHTFTEYGRGASELWWGGVLSVKSDMEPMTFAALNY